MHLYARQPTGRISAEFTSGMYRKGKIPALFYPNLMETSWDSSDVLVHHAEYKSRILFSSVSQCGTLY